MIYFLTGLVAVVALTLTAVTIAAVVALTLTAVTIAAVVVLVIAIVRAAMTVVAIVRESIDERRVSAEAVWP